MQVLLLSQIIMFFGFQSWVTENRLHANPICMDEMYLAWNNEPIHSTMVFKLGIVIRQLQLITALVIKPDGQSYFDLNEMHGYRVNHQRPHC